MTTCLQPPPGPGAYQRSPVPTARRPAELQRLPATGAGEAVSTAIAALMVALGALLVHGRRSASAPTRRMRQPGSPARDSDPYLPRATGGAAPRAMRALFGGAPATAHQRLAATARDQRWVAALG